MKVLMWKTALPNLPKVPGVLDDRVMFGNAVMLLPSLHVIVYNVIPSFLLASRR